MTSTLPDSLALLSLQTALQIDRKLKGRAFDPTVLARFGAELSQAVGGGVAPQATFLATDPVTAEVFSEAIEETSQTTLNTIGEVADYTQRVVGGLLEQPNTLSEAALTDIKLFCLAFHKSMLAQQMPALSERESSLDNELRFA